MKRGGENTSERWEKSLSGKRGKKGEKDISTSERTT